MTDKEKKLYKVLMSGFLTKSMGIPEDASEHIAQNLMKLCSTSDPHEATRAHGWCYGAANTLFDVGYITSDFRNMLLDFANSMYYALPEERQKMYHNFVFTMVDDVCNKAKEQEAV